MIYKLNKDFLLAVKQSYLLLKYVVGQIFCKTYSCDFYAFVYRHRGKDFEVITTGLVISLIICF